MEPKDKVQEVVDKFDGKKKRYRMKWSQWDSEGLIEAFSEEEALQIAKSFEDEMNRRNRGNLYFCDEIEEVE